MVKSLISPVVGDLWVEPFQSPTMMQWDTENEEKYWQQPS